MTFMQNCVNLIFTLHKKHEFDLEIIYIGLIVVVLNLWVQFLVPFIIAQIGASYLHIALDFWNHVLWTIKQQIIFKKGALCINSIVFDSSLANVSNSDASTFFVKIRDTVVNL